MFRSITTYHNSSRLLMKTNNEVEYKVIGDVQPQPHDDETERAVLATLIQHNDIYNRFSDLLEPDLFYVESYKSIFRCVDGVLKEGGITDINSLYAYSRSHDVGFELYKGDFSDVIMNFSISTFEQDLNRLRNLSKRRTVWKQLQITASKILVLTEDADETVNCLMSSIGELQQDMSDTGVYSFNEAINELSDIVKGNLCGKSIFIRTGFRIFDDYFLLRPNTLTVIAAFTSVGKSALAMNIAVNASRQGIGVGYYSLEMGKSELAARGLSADAGIPSSSLLNKKLYETEMQKFDYSVKKNSDLPIYIDERSTVSFDRTIRSIRTLRKSIGIGLAIIDYLQIYAQVNDNIESSLAYMARAAKNIAKELGIPVILLSQLNRSSAHPSIKMLRGSGQIEESADNIVLIDRPEAYPDNSVRYEGDFSDEDTHGTAKLILAKGRGVGTGSELVGFDGRYTQFYEFRSDENNPTEPINQQGNVTDEVPF